MHNNFPQESQQERSEDNLRVKVRHSVKLKDILKIIKSKLLEVSELSKTFLSTKNNIEEYFFNLENYRKCIQELDKMREILSEMNVLYEDCSEMLIGFEKISLQLNEMKAQNSSGEKNE